jgi:hypothetical protein
MPGERRKRISATADQLRAAVDAESRLLRRAAACFGSAQRSVTTCSITTVPHSGQWLTARCDGDDPRCRTDWCDVGWHASSLLWFGSAQGLATGFAAGRVVGHQEGGRGMGTTLLQRGQLGVMRCVQRPRGTRAKCCSGHPANRAAADDELPARRPFLTDPRACGLRTAPARGGQWPRAVWSPLLPEWRCAVWVSDATQCGTYSRAPLRVKSRARRADIDAPASTPYALSPAARPPCCAARGAACRMKCAPRRASPKPAVTNVRATDRRVTRV